MIAIATLRHFGSRGGLRSERWSRDLTTEVRIMFEGTFITFPLPSNATFADLAEKVCKVVRHGEPRRVDLLFRPSDHATQPHVSPSRAA